MTSTENTNMGQMFSGHLQEGPANKKRKVPMVKPVEPPKSMDHPKVPYHGTLPWHEFSLGIIAPKGSGKTTMICNFLLDFYKNYFHEIYIFSPTINNDDKWGVVQKAKGLLAENKRYIKFLKYVQKQKQKAVFVPPADEDEPNVEEELKKTKEFNESDRRIPEKNFMVEYSKETLQTLVDGWEKHLAFLQKYLPEDKKFSAKFFGNRRLIIFDDLVGSNLFTNSQQNNPFKGLNTRHRHWSCSMLIVSQAYKEIPKTIRTNLTGWVFFRISNQSELDVIYEENPCGFTHDQWMSLYRHVIESGDHAFLYINHYFKKPKNFNKNFSHSVWML